MGSLPAGLVRSLTSDQVTEMEVHQARDVGYPGALADLPVAIGQCPAALGQVEPDRVRQALADQLIQELVCASHPVSADQNLAAGPASAAMTGSCVSAARTTAMWSAAVFEPAFPLRSRHDSSSHVPSAPRSTDADGGWKQSHAWTSALLISCPSVR